MYPVRQIWCKCSANVLLLHYSFDFPPGAAFLTSEDARWLDKPFLVFTFSCKYCEQEKLEKRENYHWKPNKFMMCTKQSSYKNSTLHGNFQSICCWKKHMLSNISSGSFTSPKPGLGCCKYKIKYCVPATQQNSEAKFSL